MSGGVSNGIPLSLLTDNDGPSQRLRVDPGQTGFFAGKMFRTYREFNIPTVGPAVFLRFTSPIDFILWQQNLDVDLGGVRLEVFTGATPSGTWTLVPPVGVNRMVSRPQPYYAAQAGIYTGGTFTGGTEVDLLRARCASQTVSASNVGTGQDNERGLPAGDYYIKLSSLAGTNDTAVGIYRIIWEERG